MVSSSPGLDAGFEGSLENMRRTQSRNRNAIEALGGAGRMVSPGGCVNHGVGAGIEQQAAYGIEVEQVHRAHVDRAPDVAEPGRIGVPSDGHDRGDALG